MSDELPGFSQSYRILHRARPMVPRRSAIGVEIGEPDLEELAKPEPMSPAA
jgi:hypothetical protein